MKYYKNLPIETIPLLETTSNDNYTITITTSSTIHDILRLTIDSENLEQKLEYDNEIDWENISCNLLFDVLDSDYTLSQIIAIVNFFRSKNNIFWIKLNFGKSLDVKGFLDEYLIGEELEYKSIKNWVEIPFNINRLNIHFDQYDDIGLKRRLMHYKECDISNNSVMEYNFSCEQISGDDESTYIVAPTDSFSLSKRNSLLCYAKRTSKFIIKSLTRHEDFWGDSCNLSTCSGSGIGIISMHKFKRIVPKNFIREYVELDSRYPQFFTHIMRLNNDPLVKMIVLDHSVDALNTLIVGEKVTPTYHTRQFQSLKNALLTKTITKPIMICTEYPAIAAEMYEVGAFVASNYKSAIYQINEIIDIFLINNILNYKMEIVQLDN